MTAENQLRAILERHCASLPGEIDSALAKFMEAVLVPARYGELAQEATQIVHRINGSSGSLGFSALSAAARLLEDALNESLLAGMPPGEAEIRMLHGLMSDMQKIGERTRPEDSRLFELDIAKIGQSS
jgi:HPt (histidine-containing phosphotransfer) domain-containing protein